jgi:hypothetical protein
MASRGPSSKNLVNTGPCSRKADHVRTRLEREFGISGVGERTDPDGGPCLRCKGKGIDADPLAPTGIPVAS